MKVSLGGGPSQTIPGAVNAGAFALRPEEGADAGFAFALFAAYNAPTLAGTGLPPPAVDG